MTANTCGKRRFTTREQAEGQAAKLNMANAQRGDTHPVHGYECPSCGWWHTGHVPSHLIVPPEEYRSPMARPLFLPGAPGEQPPTECATCGYPVALTKRRGWIHPSAVQDDHPIVPQPVVDQWCLVCDKPVKRRRKNRLEWVHIDGDQTHEAVVR